MCKYRRARCVRCRTTFLVEKGEEESYVCPECGAKYFTYSIVVKGMGSSQGKPWRQQALS